MRTSVIIPTVGSHYLKYLLYGLANQIRRPNEVILVIKGDVNFVEKICNRYSLHYVLIEQEKGFFTTALNIGKREASADIIIFTDEDAIPPKKWVLNYINLHRAYNQVAGISSRDVYISLDDLRYLPTPDDRIHVRLYRFFIRPWLEPPHPLLKKYRLGVYLTKNLNTAYGPFIPHKACFSLPFKGVNMSFKREYVYDIFFPEHPLLKRGLNNERYFGLQLLLKGFDCIYVPHNVTFHIARKSLSRPSKAELAEVNREKQIMHALMEELIVSGKASI